MVERAFILTPTHRVHGGQAEVHLHVTLECGEPALLIDDRFEPHCFVAARDAEAVRGAHVTPTSLRTFAGEPVVRVGVALPGDLPPLRRRLAATGIPCFEGDVRFAYRWMIDHGVQGALAVDGRFARRPGVGRVYRNPVVRPATWTPALRVLSFDIETSPDAGRVYAIACAGAGGDRAWMVRRHPVTGADVVPDERTLLERFLAHVRAVDPDVLTGWNVCDFDLTVLLAACRRAGLRCAVGRGDDEVVLLRDQGFTRDARAVLAGRVVLDGLALMRSNWIRLDDYRLETAARTLLGTGKLIAGEHRGAEIEAAWRDDPERLAAYNLQDARLVMELLAHTGLVELTVRRSLLTGMPLDRVSAQIAAIDSLYLRALRPRGVVAPSVEGGYGGDGDGISGGLVLESQPGLYRNVLVFDFKSLYPSLIRTFNIDPLTHVPAPPPGAAVIATPSGAAFRRDEPGILPALVARLWDERAAARAAGDVTCAQAIKILMNSLFGVLGSPASRLFSPAVANAITQAGQHVIRLAADAVARRGHRVIYGDTDSLFVDAGCPDAAAARATAERLREEVGGDVAASLAREFQCTSHLELEFEKVYARFLLPEVRSGAAGSKKRYAGLVGDRLEIVGLEAVRRDWSGVARRFQRALVDLVLRDQPVEAFVRGFVADLRAGRFDDELVYRKAIRKPLDSYTRTTPPHVKAARKLGGSGGRVVAYVMTTAGPEPAGELGAPPDREHYVTHQLKPLADAVLRFLGGPDFDDLSGARKQLTLF